MKRLLWILLGLFAGPVFGADYTEEERAHWSLQPRQQPAVPQFTDAADRAWIRNPIDAFILERLRKAGLSPAPPAEPAVLARRYFLHVTGLPPTPEELAELLADASPVRDDRLVDRLLASPAYGEQWGQHWLDVVRYAETEGFEYDRHRPGAWRYRDYVIASFNGDLPYDQFVREQLAGDEGSFSREEAVVAAGFHRLGPVRRNAGNSDVAFSRNEVLTEMTDAVGSVFLGLTVGCARCHDHMFDPVRQRDYYQLQAFFAATQEHDIQLGDADTIRAWNALNSELQAEIKRLREALNDTDVVDREELVEKLKEVEARVPRPLPTISTVRNEWEQRTPVHLLERGLTERPLEAVQPDVLGVLRTSNQSIPADTSHPKTELARWLTQPEHPLTARVIVNRLWHYHFGQGLVSTPNDFGMNGGVPSHEALLDFLANELVAHGWQLKPIQRWILTSATYRQGSRSVEDAVAQRVDPSNRLLSRFPRRRLTAEQLRDSMLSVSGRLESRFGGPSVIPPVSQELVHLLYAPQQWEVTPDRREHDRRSVYLIAKRNLRLPYLEVFDQPDLQISCSRREASTHAPQALELLNGDLANDLAAAFAERLRQEVGEDLGLQIERAFQLAVGRSPTSLEREQARTFLAEQPLRELTLALFNINAFLYID